MHSLKKTTMKTTLLNLTFFLCAAALYAQGVKISPQPGTPDPSAILETQDTTRGVLMPRVNLQNSTDAVTIANPATSLMVFNTGATLAPAGFYYNAGTPQAPQWALVLPNPANTNLNMNGFAIENLATPVNPADAVTKDYVDNQIINVSGSGSGGTCFCPSMMSNESAQSMTFHAANTYCRTLSENGFTDWQMPNTLEVFNLFRNPSVTIPNVNSTNYFWCLSQPGGNNTLQPWYIRFSDFGQSSASINNNFYARCVR
jgi:hypothetical protein